MSVRRRLQRAFDAWRDPITRDLSRSGDLFVARVRIAIVLALAPVPIGTALASPGRPEAWLGLATVVVALAVSVWFERLAARPMSPRWLGFVTSQFDVAVISLGFVSFIIAGRAILATNSLVHYTLYFVALAGTTLRYDPRVSLAAGLAAMLQYGAIVVWIGWFEPSVWQPSPIYGVFQWDSQVSRLQLIAAATVLHVAAVVRSRTFWLGSMRDPLTGLYNRAFFEDRLARLFAQPNATPQPYTLALIDLDHFKTINDRYGHAAGDEALQFAARRLREEFRGHDLIVRYGGEEFAVLIQAEHATAAARFDAWREGLHAEARIPRLSASVGVASVPTDGTPSAVVGVADRRLYAAKAAGRNRTVAGDHEAA